MFSVILFCIHYLFSWWCLNWMKYNEEFLILWRKRYQEGTQSVTRNYLPITNIHIDSSFSWILLVTNGTTGCILKLFVVNIIHSSFQFNAILIMLHNGELFWIYRNSLKMTCSQVGDISQPFNWNFSHEGENFPVLIKRCGVYISS